MSDVVVVVPGIMGSELADSSGDVLWGMRAGLAARAIWDSALANLRVTEDDIAGGGRVRATRLLARPAYLPVWGGLEPYKLLVDHLRRERDSRSVYTFAYDWRLPIDVTGPLLAERCAQALEAWSQVVAQERLGDPAEVRVVLVAHSMGGLVSRWATGVCDAGKVVRKIITLATPYVGSIKALQMIAGDRFTVSVPQIGDVPLPRPLQRALTGLAVSCPAVYDLLPRYRCVTHHTNEEGVRHLSVDDVVDSGGDRELAVAAESRAERLAAALSKPGAEITPVTALAGSFQPTLQNVTLDAGICRFHYSSDVGGDSTVLRRAAKPAEIVEASPLPQRHGALARSVEARTFVLDRLAGADDGLPLGTGPISVDLPLTATAGDPVTITVTAAGEDSAPISVAAATVTSENLDTGLSRTWQLSPSTGRSIAYTCTGMEPGLHRITSRSGGYSPVSEVMLVNERSIADRS